MHISVIRFFEEHAVAAEFADKAVLEVGSYDVNGGLRTFVEVYSPRSYTGTDMRFGPGVDAVVSAEKLLERFAAGCADAVICTEMLEHAKNWRGAIDAMKGVLAVGGVIYLTTRGPGYPLHDYPRDYWRFTVADMRAIFGDFDIVACEADPQVPGVFVKARKTGSVPVDLMAISPVSMED